jgi:uncharacterized membrane protein
MPDALLVLTFVTALGSAVAAGAFFAFSNFVMRALGRIPAAAGIRAMQEINVTVINRWFMTALFGTGVACLALVVVALLDWEGSYGPYLVSSGALYVVGTVVVTMALNVPRNQALARVEPGSGEGAAVWDRYLAEWTRWNSVRTVASLATTAALIAGIAAS